MEFLGIHFVPLNLPLKKRLETLAVAWFFIIYMIVPFICLFFYIYILFFTRYSSVAILYGMWLIYDIRCAHRGGRRFECYRSLKIWDYYQAYFPLSLHKTADIPPNRNYLFCAYPHGLLCCGAYGHFGTNCTEFSSLFPNLTPYLLTLNIGFNMPIAREIILATGMCAASRESILHLLQDSSHHKVVVLMVGGAEEASYCRPNTYRIILKKRRGFIRIALETGTPIVPVFSFGETSLYDQITATPGSWHSTFQHGIRKAFGINPCIPIGRGLLQYNFGFIPRCHPVATVVGTPIDVPKMSSFSDDVVDEIQKQFTNALIDLFEKYKHKFEKDPHNCKLIIE